MEKVLMEEQNIAANEFCSKFSEKAECKNDEYTVCNWCDEHKPESQSNDKSVRCVSAAYHWLECQRQIIAPMKKERTKHKFDWSKSKPIQVEKGKMTKKNDFNFDKLLQKKIHQGGVEEPYVQDEL